MEVVYEAATAIDAYLVRHAFEQADIPVFVRGEALVGGIGELPACSLLTACVPHTYFSHVRAAIESLPLLTGVAAATAHSERCDCAGAFDACPQVG